jgi:hypothetical protein
VSSDSEFRSEGSVPVSDLEAKLIDVTRFEPSHLTPVQLQNVVVDDQPDGVGVRAFASLDMKTPSSAMAVWRRREKERKSLEREIRVLSFDFGGAIGEGEEKEEKRREERVIIMV